LFFDEIVQAKPFHVIILGESKKDSKK